MAADQRKYSNPPIQEAICEVHFAIEQPLALDKLEQLKGLWKSDYPNQSVNEEKNVHLQMGAEGVRIDESKQGQRLICRTSDGTRLVQLSGRFVAINQLKPYPGWEEGYRETILARLRMLNPKLAPCRYSGLASGASTTSRFPKTR